MPQGQSVLIVDDDEGLAQIVALIRSEGSPLAEDDLRGSDVILPPPDTSFAEASGEFTGEGLIPG